MTKEILAVKLIGGEVVIGYVTKNRWKREIVIQEAQECLITYAEGRAEVELAPWNPYAMDYTFKVPFHAVVTTFKVRPNLEINYKKSTGNIKEK